MLLDILNIISIKELVPCKLNRITSAFNYLSNLGVEYATDFQHEIKIRILNIEFLIIVITTVILMCKSIYLSSMAFYGELLGFLFVVGMLLLNKSGLVKWTTILSVYLMPYYIFFIKIVYGETVNIDSCYLVFFILAMIMINKRSHKILAFINIAIAYIGGWVFLANFSSIFDTEFHLFSEFVLLVCISACAIVAVLEYSFGLEKLVNKQLKLKNEIQYQLSEIIQLKQDNINTNELFGIVAHDLKGPILTLDSIASKLVELMNKKDWNSIEKMAKYYDDLGGKVKSSVLSLIEWTALNKDRISFENKSIELPTLIKRVKKDLGYLSDSKNQKIVDKTSGKIVFDENALLILLRNLIQNGLIHGSVNGQVTISNTIIENQHVLEITNQGDPFPNRILNKIESYIENGYQEINNLRQEGLGLNIVLKILDYKNLKIHLSREQTKELNIIQIYLS